MEKWTEGHLDRKLKIHVIKKTDVYEYCIGGFPLDKIVMLKC